MAKLLPERIKNIVNTLEEKIAASLRFCPFGLDTQQQWDAERHKGAEQDETRTVTNVLCHDEENRNKENLR